MLTGKNRADEGVITKHLFQRSMFTMTVAELTNAVTAIVGGMLIGNRLGSTALAASGLAAPYYSVASVISGFLMVGSTNLYTKAIGTGDRKRLSSVFSLTVGLGALLSVLLALCGILFPRFFADLFGAGNASEAVFAATTGHLRGLFLGAPGFILYVVLIPVLQLDGDSQRPRIAGCAYAATAMTGFFLNVFVFHGGMFGMGLSVSAGHYAALLTMLTHFFRKESLFRFSPGEIRASVLPPLLRDGLPRSVCMLSRAALPMILNTLILRLVGDAGVSAYSVLGNSTFLFGALGWGIGGAVLIVGGMMAGEEDVNGLRSVIRSALTDILAGVTALAAVIFLLAPQIARMFIPEPGPAQEMALAAVRCYAVCLPFLAFNVSAANYLQTVSRMFGSVLVNIGIEAAFTAVSAFVLSAFLGVAGVWLAFPAGQALLTLVLLLRIYLFTDKDRSGAESRMLLRKGFGIPQEDRLEASPDTIAEVTGMSEQARMFCMERGISEDRAYKLALCLEEIATNVIEFGFSDGKPHHMDVRVLVKGSSVILRMRDDCVRFDLREQAEKWTPDPEHPEACLGVRLVLQAAKDISYTNTMNTNNLIITV